MSAPPGPSPCEASPHGRKATDISLPLTVLRNCGLLMLEPDAFRANRAAYRIAEPLIAFHHAVVRPQAALLSRRRRAAQVWGHSRSAFLSKVVGPHFEQLGRPWAEGHAAPETFGGMPIQVSAGTVADPDPDPDSRTSLEADVVVHGAIGQDQGILLSVGEVTWQKVMDLGHLERLRRILHLLDARGVDTTHATPACYSGVGFSPELREAAARGEVPLVDPERLYRGSWRPARGAGRQKARNVSAPCLFQRIAHRGACGKAPVVPQNRRPGSEPVQIGDSRHVCPFVRVWASSFVRGGGFHD
ncbi:hypothetical protein [Streptomyces sp. NEAU-W12]|uniref:hypothetical protein n=1 Tax=Streptomyces sp. NEAU-W12 TaxID=2994668 RepID=UPI00224B5A2D|nr:hypothetical protein [Streptomyces sp. NEAU-W12]MCX2927551.1 hypothetical protein [Streptomyces sp. NEAU-W12]